MDKVTVSCSVFFEEPYWVGLVECLEAGSLRVCKITFGAEPKDYHIYEFLTSNYYKLRFGPPVEGYAKKQHTNPKKKQRDIQKYLGEISKGTKSQQALNLQREEMKTERRVRSREQKELEKQQQFELKQQKKKEKHRGR